MKFLKLEKKCLLNRGAGSIAGTVVGLTFFFIFVALIVVCCRRRHRPVPVFVRQSNAAGVTVVQSSSSRKLKASFYFFFLKIICICLVHFSVILCLMIIPLSEQILSDKQSVTCEKLASQEHRWKKTTNKQSKYMFYYAPFELPSLFSVKDIYPKKSYTERVLLLVYMFRSVL